MKYVLDASLALSWVIPRPSTSKAIDLREDFRNHIHELIAPSTFGAEVASGLTKAERQKLIPIGGDGVHLLADILRTSPLIHAYDPFLFRATELSSAVPSGLHDCLYIALAEQEGCELVTVDDKLLKNVQRDFPFVIHLGTV
jgi:predicted nucleic acid-binding protein